MREEIRHLQGQVGWLVGMVARLLRVQQQQANAIAGLERRTRPAARGGRHQRRRSDRPLLRLVVQTVGVLLAGLAVAVVFSSGTALGPSSGMGAPPAQADPTTTGDDGDGLVSPPEAGAAGGGVQRQAPHQPTTSTTLPAARPAGGAPATSSATPLLLLPSTTLPAVTSTTLPEEEPTSTRVCRNPHGCDRGP